jgi:hypothetical protein
MSSLENEKVEEPTSLSLAPFYTPLAFENAIAKNG